MLPVALAIIQGVLSMSKKKKGQDAANMLSGFDKMDSLMDKTKNKNLLDVIGTEEDEDEDEEED